MPACARRYPPFMYSKGGKRKPRALRHLAESELGLTIQTGQHSSIDDARAALYLYQKHAGDWEGGGAASARGDGWLSMSVTVFLVLPKQRHTNHKPHSFTRGLSCGPLLVIGSLPTRLPACSHVGARTQNAARPEAAGICQPARRGRQEACAQLRRQGRAPGPHGRPVRGGRGEVDGVKGQAVTV